MNIFKVLSIALLLTTSFSLSAQRLAPYDNDPLIIQSVNDISKDNIIQITNDLVAFYTRNNLSTTTDLTKGIGAAADYIFRRASSYIPQSNSHLTVEKSYYTTGGPETRLGREVTLCNIVATLQGSASNVDSREIVLLAHYDSRTKDGNDSTSFAPGANDNCSGVAALMEIVRILSTKPLPITVKCIFVSGEEHGLLGAGHEASLAFDKKLNIIAVINNDMIGNAISSDTGYSNGDTVRVFSENIPVVESEKASRRRSYVSAENDSPSRQLARYVKETAEQYIPGHHIQLVYRNDRFGRNGDHMRFAQKGYTAVRLCEYHENYNRTHQPVTVIDGVEYGDMPVGVNFDYVRKNAMVNLSTIMNLALAPDVPQAVKLKTEGLSNYTFLSWKAPEVGTKVNCYCVLKRATDQSTWSVETYTTDTSIQLPYSKDNFFYAIQCVDSQGHKSLPVFAY